MPRRNNRRNSKNSQSPNGARIERISGRQYFSASVPTTGSTFNIIPLSFTRASAIADVYGLCRLKKLRVTMCPQNTAGYAVGYAPGVLDTAPATMSEIVALPEARYQSGFSTMPQSFDIPPQELLGDNQIKWFKTVAGAADSNFEIQGALYLSSEGVTSTIKLVLDYVYEFQSWSLANNTPLRKINRAIDSGEPATEVLISGVKYVLVPPTSVGPA